MHCLCTSLLMLRDYSVVFGSSHTNSRAQSSISDLKTLSKNRLCSSVKAFFQSPILPRQQVESQNNDDWLTQMAEAQTSRNVRQMWWVIKVWEHVPVKEKTSKLIKNSLNICLQSHQTAVIWSETSVKKRLDCWKWENPTHALPLSSNFTLSGVGS